MDDEAVERRRAMIRERAKKRALEDVSNLNLALDPMLVVLYNKGLLAIPHILYML